MVADYANYRDRNGNLASWMGTSSRRTPEYMNAQELSWHNKNCGPNGPDLGELLKLNGGGPQGHDSNQRAKLLGELRKMRYTTDGPGCRIIDILPNGRPATYEAPGRDAVAPGSARNEDEAAAANRFYPDMPGTILLVCLFQYHPLEYARVTPF